jgi:hypothetical protein
VSRKVLRIDGAMVVRRLGNISNSIDKARIYSGERNGLEVKGMQNH